jgi:hypothetical protein
LAQVRQEELELYLHYKLVLQLLELVLAERVLENK